MEDAVRALQQPMNALMSQNAALEAQFWGDHDCVDSFTSTDEKDACPTRKAWESRQCSQAEKKTSTCGPRRSRTSCLVCSRPCVWSFGVCCRVAKTWSQPATVAIGVETCAEIDGQLFVTVKASTLSCQQEVTMASRAGASCMESGTRTRRGEREVS